MFGWLKNLWGPWEPPSELADLRRREAVAAQRMRTARLEHAAARTSLRESSFALDWVTAIGDLYKQLQDTADTWALVGPTGPYQRQQGRNFPFYQSEQQLNIIRAPSRVICGSNVYAIGLLDGVCSYVVSTGYTYQAESRSQDQPADPELLAAVQEVIDDFLTLNQWAGPNELGAEPSLEEEGFWRSREDGELLLDHQVDDRGRTHVRVVEPELLTQKPNTDFREWGFGVRTDPADPQRPLAYWVQWDGTPATGEEIDAGRITHLKLNVRRGMKRGLPDFAFETQDLIDLAGRLTGNLGETAAEQAAIVFVRQHDNASRAAVEGFIDEQGDYTQTDPLTSRLEQIARYRRGRHEDIPKGMNYVAGPIASATPIHLQVLTALLRAAGRRWQAPDWVISGDASNNNYASSLTAESPFVRRVLRAQKVYREVYRRSVLIALENYCRWRGGLRAVRLDPQTGRPAGDGVVYDWRAVRQLVDVQVTAPSPETRNKLEEAQRDQVYIGLGVKDRQTAAEEQGLDWETVAERNREYDEQHQAEGLPLELGGLNGDGTRAPGLRGRGAGGEGG